MEPSGATSLRADSSFLNTIHEDQSDGTGSVHNAASVTATTNATAPSGTATSLKNLLSQRIGKTGAPSVCNSSVNSSTGGIDSVEGKLSVVSDMQAVVLGGTDTEEYDGTSPASVLADAGHAKSEQHRDTGKVRTFCCFVVTRRNLYLGVAVLLLTLGVLSAIVAVVVTNQSGSRRGRSGGTGGTDPQTPEWEFRNYVTSLLRDTSVDASVWDNPESASSRARDWIVYNDTLRDEILQEGLLRLKQRYALAHMWFATSGPTHWSLNTTLSEDASIDFLNPSTSECNWTGVTCDRLELEVRSEGTNSSFDEKNHVFRLLFQGMNLTGSIPAELGTCIPSVRELDFSYNALQGTIPPVLFEGGWFSSLYWLDLSENQLTGSIPPALWSLQRLEYLYLYENNLTGQIVRHTEAATDEANATGTRQGNFLKEVALYRNALTGSLPIWIGELIDLRDWLAYENQFSGPLVDPPESLEWFDMSFNQLTGPIPDTMWSLPTSPPLQKLYLDHNQLSGLLPSASRRQGMQTLWLHNNLLSGPIPDDFALEWNQLKDLRIQGNSLTGTLGPIDANATECAAIWPAERKFIAECLEQRVTDVPPVQCDCCNECV